MRPWKVISVVALAMSAGCDSTPRARAEDPIGETDSRSTTTATTPAIETPRVDPFAIGGTYDQLEVSPGFVPAPAMGLGAPVAFWMGAGGAMLSGLGGTVFVLSLLDSSPISFVTGGGGLGVIVLIGAVSLFSVRSSDVEDKAGPPDSGKAHKRPKPSDMDMPDPDMPAPVPAPKAPKPEE